MSELPWVRFFPSDWLAGTRGMSAAETGIYITLIATMYERGEPIPEDHSRLARLCGASNSSFRKALDTLVDEGKIQRIDGLLWNDRVGRESELRSEKSTVGRQAAEARWSKKDNKNNTDDDANALPTQSERNANQKPEARSQKERKTEPNGSAKNGTRIPDAWGPGADGRKFAADAGLTAEQIDREVAKFRDYWSAKAGASARKLDWAATWRNWVRTAAERSRAKIDQPIDYRTREEKEQEARLKEYMRGVL